MAYIRTFYLSDGVAFARAVKASTDLGDKLTDIQVDQLQATAACTFQQGSGAPAPPAGNPLSYDVSNGVAFARALKVHTDINNHLVSIVVHVAIATAECWFA
jgi:hypothetical protein